MLRKKKRNKDYGPDGVYLTKRLLVRAARKGFKEASEETMRVMGFNVIVEGDWVVKKYADGRIEKIKELERVSREGGIVLD